MCDAEHERRGWEACVGSSAIFALVGTLATGSLVISLDPICFLQENITDFTVFSFFRALRSEPLGTCPDLRGLSGSVMRICFRHGPSRIIHQIFSRSHSPFRRTIDSTYSAFAGYPRHHHLSPRQPFNRAEERKTHCYR